MIAAVLVMVLSSALYAPALVLQHQGSQESIGALNICSPPFRDLLRNRIWLAGLVLFYVAAGILAATYAMVIKGVLDSTGWERVFFIALTIVSAISFPIVSAEAFKATAVTVSTSVTIPINPVYASLASVWLFGVSLTSSPPATVVLVISVMVMLLGVLSLSRSTSLG